MKNSNDALIKFYKKEIRRLSFKKNKDIINGFQTHQEVETWCPPNNMYRTLAPTGKLTTTITIIERRRV